MEELRVRLEDATLAASYTPAGETVVVAVHGAGEATRTASVLYPHLHAVLPPVGVGVVTFDRRGEGESTGESVRGRFEAQARDALAVAAATGAERVGLWGYSQGGWVAPLAATISPDLAFLVLVAASGVRPEEQMRYATERQLRLAGYDDAAVAQALELRRRVDAWAHGGDDEAAVNAALWDAIDAPWFGLTFLPPMLPDEEGRRLWLDEMDFDPTSHFAGLDVPTLAFYGTEDSWTPVAPSAAAWRELGADVVLVEGAEHDLTLPDGSLAPEYERSLVDWLSRAQS